MKSRKNKPYTLDDYWKDEMRQLARSEQLATPGPARDEHIAKMREFWSGVSFTPDPNARPLIYDLVEDEGDEEAKEE